MIRLFSAICFFCAPILAADFAVYIGDGYEYKAAAMTVDEAGNSYVAGTRQIPPASGDTPNAATDIFVTKLDDRGAIIFTVTLSGKGNDSASGVAVDRTGNILVAGSTTSLNFPLKGALQSSPGHGGTGFLVKLDSVGSLVFSTYFGGMQASSQLNAVAVDQAGDVYVTGSSNSRDYPRTAGLPAGTVIPSGPGPISGALFAKISAAGDKIIYSGLISGTQRACSGGSSCFLSTLTTGGSAIGVDGAGNAYVAGNSNATDLPATGGVLFPTGLGAFVFKINADGNSLAYLTYLSKTRYGSGTFVQSSTTVRALAADVSGNVYLTGSTSDPNFPATAGAVQTAYSLPVNDNVLFGAPPASDSFVAKLRSDGTAMTWATYFGTAASAESGTSIAVRGSGAVYLAGTSTTRQAMSADTREFVAEFDSLGASVRTKIQPVNTTASGIALGSQGSFRQIGETGILASVGSLFAGTRVFGPSNGARGVLKGRISPGEIISIYGEELGPGSAITATASSGMFPTSLGEMQVTIGGVSAPLLYVSPTQINTIVPTGSLRGTSVPIRILVRGELRAEFRAVVVAADPQFFRSATGSVAAVNEDGTINSASNPARWGSFVAAWATGAGSFPGLDGQVAADPDTYCSCSVFGNDSGPSTSLLVTYGGSSPGLVNGAVQVNFRLPTGSGSRTILVVLGAGGNVGEAGPIYVAQ